MGGQNLSQSSTKLLLEEQYTQISNQIKGRNQSVENGSVCNLINSNCIFATKVHNPNFEENFMGPSNMMLPKPPSLPPSNNLSPVVNPAVPPRLAPLNSNKFDLMSLNKNLQLSNVLSPRDEYVNLQPMLI